MDVIFMKKLISTCLVALTLAATMAFTVYAETPVNEEPIPFVTEETTYEEPAQIPAEAGEPSLLADCTNVKTEYIDISQCRGSSCDLYGHEGVYGTGVTQYVCSDGTYGTRYEYNVRMYCCY